MKTTLLISFLLLAVMASGQRLVKGIYTVPNTSFHPDLNLGYQNGNAGDGVASAEMGTGSRLVASVQLPQGAVVDSVKLYFVDYSDVDMYISLASYENATGSGLKDLFTSTTNGKSSAVRNLKAPVGSFTIDNERNGYYLLVQPKGAGWPKNNTLGTRSVVFYYH